MMRLSYEWLILIILVLLSICLTDSASNKSSTSIGSSQRNVRQTLNSEPNEQQEQKEEKAKTSKQQRPRRQKPTKKKTGVFGSFKSLVKDTIRDTRVAYRNISRLVEDTFRAPTTPADTAVSASGGNDNVTTPAPPGAPQVFDLLGKNIRGLRKLWDSEMQLAMSESKKNIKKFQKELRESIRPFLLPSNNET